MAKIIFLDNFDSFTYNLVDQLRSLGHKVSIYRNDYDIDKLVEITLSQPDTILTLSPGPGNPQQAGNMLALIQRLKGRVPILGICLGHQALIEATGGKVISASDIMHGKVAQIEHDGKAMFANLPNPMAVARYHSLVGDNLSDEWEINAHCNEMIMAIRHKTLPMCSFQFHPESLLTVYGSTLLAQTVEWLLGSR